MIRTGFHVPRPTQVPASCITRYPYGGVTLYAGVFQTPSGSCDVFAGRSYNPGMSVNTPV